MNHQSHFEELICEGFTLEQANTAVRIAERRALAELYAKVGEVIHHLCERLEDTPAGLALRRALNDDGRSQAQAAASVGVTKQTLSKSEERIRARIKKGGG